ncbi:MAG: GTP 3',8-cyclase MoaA [Planctomycetes bacterium]|nr:GTP 3',8-cyclase MoaA [Planctomycetota bacterium]
MTVVDTFQRPLRNLRLSVTDRCNLRCAYCMPEEEYAWLPRASILDFEEVARLVTAFTALGVDKVRITGGEPLLRRELATLVRLLAANPKITDLALTTNGVLLDAQASELRAAGLGRVTVSLDTLKPEVFRELARRDDLERVKAGIRAAKAAGFPSLKLDAVILRGTNDGELCDLLEYARGVGAELRYIEYMDVGGATRWSQEHVVSRAEMLARIADRYGAIEPLREASSAPAERFRLKDGTVFGIIASTTAPFCGSCDRSRLTADGMWYRCLYATRGTNLREALRSGLSEEQLNELIGSTWRVRTDRGAEERLAAHERGALAPRETLAQDPHLEMHTRGG